MRGISPYPWIQSLPPISDCKDSSVLQVLSSSNTDQYLPSLFSPHYAFPLFPTLWNAMKAKKNQCNHLQTKLSPSCPKWIPLGGSQQCKINTSKDTAVWHTRSEGLLTRALGNEAGEGEGS